MKNKKYLASLKKLIFTFNLTAIATLTLSASLETIKEITVFGDSLSEMGNVYQISAQTIPPVEPYYQGRFSDGRVWIELSAEELNLDLQPSSTGGNNYAYAGARSSDGYFNFSANDFLDNLNPNQCSIVKDRGVLSLDQRDRPLPIENVGTQISSYLKKTNGKAFPETLYVIWVGGNDIVSDSITCQQTIANIKNHIRTLANAGARMFLIPNFPPFEYVPLVKELIPSEFISIVLEYKEIDQYNPQLASMLLDLEREYQDQITICQMPVHEFISEMFRNPSAYNLTNTEGTIYDKKLCYVHENKHEFVYFDDIHPSHAIHRLLHKLAHKTLEECLAPDIHIPSKDEREL